MINFIQDVLALTLFLLKIVIVIGAICFAIIIIVSLIAGMVKLLHFLLGVFYPNKPVTKMFNEVLEQEQEDKDTDGVLYDPEWYGQRN